MEGGFIKNTGFITASKIIENLFSYLIIVVLTRNLGAEGLGKYTFLMAFASFFFLFSDWGLASLLVKDLARDFRKANRYISNILSLQIVMAVVSLFIYFGSLFFIGRDELMIALIIMGLYQVAFKMKTLPMSILRVKEQGMEIAIGNILERILALIGALIAIVVYHSLMLFVVMLLISNLARTVVMYLWSSKHFKFRFHIEWAYCWSLLKQGYPFMMISLFSYIYVKIDQVMLSFIKGDMVVGWYSAGYQLITVLNVIPLILLTFGYPIFAKLSKKKKELRAFLERLLYYCLVLILPVTVGVMLTAGRLIEFIYGFNTIQSATAFRILIIAEVFVFLTMVMGDFISSSNRQKVFSNITAAGAVINLVLNLILIPRYSLYGAAFATLVTYIGLFVFAYIYINKKMIRFSLFRSLIVPSLGSILVGFVVYKLLFLNILYLILIGGIVYAPIIGAYEYYRYKKSGSFL